MCLARKLALLTAVTIAAITLVAGHASAQEEPVEVDNEPTGLHCALAAANCEHHISGQSVLTLHQFESESVVSQCNDEFLATFDEDGSGFIGTYENDAPVSNLCTRVKCDDTGEELWPITRAGEYTGTQTEEGHMSLEICLDNKATPGSAGTHCTIELAIQNLGNHHYGFSATNAECPIVGMLVWLEVDGSWESEALPHELEKNIEFIH